MNMSQCDTIVDRLYTNGLLYEDEMVDYIKKTGAVFDKGLLVARVKSINENAEKYMLPAGTKIVSSPFLVNGYTKRLYVLGVSEFFEKINVTKVVKNTLKTFYAKE